MDGGSALVFELSQQDHEQIHQPPKSESSKRHKLEDARAQFPIVKSMDAKHPKKKAQEKSRIEI